MIDIHTHILPNIDDGADSVSAASELLRMEAEQGVKEVVFTPHYYGTTTAEKFLALRETAKKSIEEYIPRGMKVRSGAEILLTGVNDPTDETICALAIEGTKCVMFELPFASHWSEHLLDRISDFIAETGYTPIIAHVERYTEALDNPSIITYLVQMGCLIQLNTHAFLEKSTRRFALALMKHGLVHCIGTDAHDPEKRAPEYAEAREVIRKKKRIDEFTNVQWCMKKILAGEALRNPYGQVKKIGKYYF
ncbi:MAG: hypothetical protein IJ329_04545 [Clostridia bacterium]|nr:hypothetical protein [Clostridia bacterium]